MFAETYLNFKGTQGFPPIALFLEPIFVVGQKTIKGFV